MMTSAQQRLARSINERYNSAMYSDAINEYYGWSGFCNFGYWTENTCDQREASENLVDVLAAMFSRRNGTILDVACGTGACSKRLLRYYRPVAITGINISDKQLATCRERAPGCRFLNMNATSLCFPANSFDNILCVEAIFHFDTREQFLREAYRVLKPGGSLVLSDVLFKSKSFTTKALGLPAANFVASLRDYRQLYINSGFKDLHVKEARRQCWESHRDSLFAFSWGKLRAGQGSWRALQPIVVRLKLCDWAIDHYLLVAARKLKDRR
jgi:MPBQ/MSBQ methyltransferase